MQHDNTPQAVTDFLRRFLKPPIEKTPQAIKDKLLHWVEVANNPQDYAHDSSDARSVANLRRKARQNIRRIAIRHPEIASLMVREHEATPAEAA